MTEFLFVRHAEAITNTTPDRIGGQSPAAPLTDKGIAQAALLGEYFKTMRASPDVIFSSGAVRTNSTASIALAQAGIEVPVLPDARLLEISQGIYEGEQRSLVYTEANMAKYNIASLAGKFPGGESVVDGQARMFDFLEETTRDYPNAHILVFSHGYAIRALAGKVLGSTKQQILDTTTHNVSLTAIDATPTTAAIRYIGKNVIPEYT